MSKTNPCRSDGCPKIAKGTTGYCFDHVHYARGCKEPGCMGRVAAYSKSGYCNTHREIGAMLRRKGVR